MRRAALDNVHMSSHDDDDDDDYDGRGLAAPDWQLQKS